MTNQQYRESIQFRIKAIQFDIECLSGGREGRVRNAKAIEALENAIRDYQKRLDSIPQNDLSFGC